MPCSFQGTPLSPAKLRGELYANRNPYPSGIEKIQPESAQVF